MENIGKSSGIRSNDEKDSTSFRSIDDADDSSSTDDPVSSSSSSSSWSSSSSSSVSSSSSASSPASSSPSSSTSSPTWPGFSLLRQRRTVLPTTSTTAPKIHNDTTNGTHHRRRTKRKTKQQNQFYPIHLHWSSWLLITALFLWGRVHWGLAKRKEDPPQEGWDWSRRREDPFHHPAKNAPFLNGYRNHSSVATQKRKKDVEDIPEGCEYSRPWQATSFPTCNLFHELDMQQDLPIYPRGGRRIQQQDTYNNENNHRYMGSGLWRDVFALLSPSLSSSSSSSSSLDRYVLKLFKMEHYEDESAYQMHRNIDRHRREANALAWVLSHYPQRRPKHGQLERLLLRPYAYCGTNLMTEWAAQSLHQAIEELLSSSTSANSLSTTSSSSSTTKGVSASTNKTMSSMLQQQQQTKLQWALHAAMGVAALHEMDVIHADLQTQQFLIKGDGTLALNDLNRCRFVPYSNITRPTSPNTTLKVTRDAISQSPCPVRIPTAPGPWRSPEEYLHHNLTTSMDVYSLGNVFYEVWTGQEPFANVGAKAWNQMVLEGTRRSSSLFEVLNARQGTITEMDRKFAQLLEGCWYVDPNQRPTAVQLANALQELVQISHEQQHPQ